MDSQDQRHGSPAPTEVVLAIDPESRAVDAIDWAARAAARRDAPLRAVTCYDPADELGFEPESDLAQYLRHRAATVVEEAADDVRLRYPTMKVAAEVLVGDPAKELTRCSANAAVMVTGSRGLGTIRGWFLGSVSSALARSAACPLVVVRPTAAPEVERNLVVAGVDLSPAAQQVLQFAFGEASRMGARLRIVLCARPDPLTTPHGSYARLLEQELAPDLGETIAGWRSEFPDVQVTADVVAEQTVRELTHASADAALLVVGSRRYGRRPLLALGSVTQGVLHHAVCPVAVVPTGAPDE
ncbi:MAG: universal stress protein [Jatrophihabitans sp.]|uniref:universal stress protein n=1 Tax=Jatrophihabitans sp. TaxID=1932789 RepID=UPI003F8049AF